jgi:hypothetical protein
MISTDEVEKIFDYLVERFNDGKVYNKNKYISHDLDIPTHRVVWIVEKEIPKHIEMEKYSNHTFKVKGVKNDKQA